MKTHLKLELLARTAIYAGVPFLSIKDVDRRYAARFSAMTVGFECEIAVSEGYDLSDDNADNSGAYEAFLNQFSFTEQNFLNSAPQGTGQAFIDHYEVDPVYGFVEGAQALQDFNETLLQIDRIGYNVVRDPRLAGDRWLPPANFSGDYLNDHLRHQFMQDRITQIDDERVKRCVTDIQMEMQAFFEKYRVSQNNDAYTLDKLMQNAAFITSYYQGFENYRTMDEGRKRQYVWRIGTKIAGIKNALQQLVIKLKSVEENGFDWEILVFDERRAIAQINLQRASELASPLIRYDRDLFLEDYQAAFDQARDADWETWEDEGRENNTGAQQRVLENIHDLVRTHVDERAELSGEYHSSYNKGARTVVEPDSSIEPYGAEVVSKAYRGVVPALKWLKSVFDMIEDQEPDLETNDTTGLHVNIGTFKAINEDYQGEREGFIDIVKLAIFSGDHYLLEQFGRLGNTYARSVGPSITDLLRNKNFNIKDYQGRFTELIKDLNIKYSGSREKYRTINITPLFTGGYIEFRIAGGEHYHRDFDKVKRAVYRYMQLCAIASDPEAYQQQYLKALYQIVHPESQEDPNKTLKTIQQTKLIKTTSDAFEYIRIVNQVYHLNLATRLTEMKKVFMTPDFNVPMFDGFMSIILNSIHLKKLKSIDFKLLYALRVLALQACRNEGRDKGRLLEEYRDFLAHANSSFLFKDPLYVKAIRFIYTGRGVLPPAQVESQAMTDTSDKLDVLASTHVTGATLVYYKNRSTPQVLKKGERAKPKQGYGPVVKRRRATKAEEEQLKKGKWIRTRHDGKGPNDRGSKRSTYRPHQGAKQKVRANEVKTYTITAIDPDGSLLKILNALQKLGSDGSSRSVDIEDVGKFGWDGDGADKITNIDVSTAEPVTAADAVTPELLIAALERWPVTAIPHPNLNKSGKPETDNWTHKLTLLMREKNAYGTFENFLQNLKASCDVGTLTTVAILGSGNLTKFQIGGQSQDQIAKNGIDTIISIDKEINPDADVYTPEEQGATVTDKEQQLKDSSTYDQDFRGPEGTREGRNKNTVDPDNVGDLK